MYNIQKKKNNLLHFRKYSRKKYAAFNSIGKQIKIATLGLSSSLIVSPVVCQSKTDSNSFSKKIELEEVEVVGQKSAILINDLPRTVELIPAEDIQNSSSQSYQDFIEYRSNIDIRQRGPAGIQSDISIRGGTFDQTLVLLNGINLTDPQTGHHSLNLPLDPETISKIEILSGPAARALGANAYNGAVNVIAVPASKKFFVASINVGGNGYFRSHLGINHVTNRTKHLLTLGHSKSNGYIYNTDFKSIHAFYSGEFNIEQATKAFIHFGIAKKDFGANGYYSAKFPDQFESNKNLFVAMGLKTGREAKTKIQVYFRQFYDRFELFREGDGYYEPTLEGFLVKNNTDTATYAPNYHMTQIFGVDLTSTLKSKFGKTTFGTSIRTENLLSNSLGDKEIDPLYIDGTDSAFYLKQGYRNSFESYLEHVYQYKKLFISSGVMANWNSFQPDRINFFPGIDMKYSIYKSVSLTGSYNYTLGLPTFTDLQYQGPANSGNDQLLPYHQHSIEAGILLASGEFKFRNVYFFNWGKNTIEWVLNNETYRFSPINVAQSESRGIEASIQYQVKDYTIPAFIFDRIYAGYTFIDTYRDVDSELSKYSSIRQKFSCTFRQIIFENFSLNWDLMYKQRTGEYQLFDFLQNEYVSHKYPDVWLVNLKANYHFKFADLYVGVSNLLNQVYYEAGNVQQPLRWVTSGLKIRFNYSSEVYK
jgi:iron complex outermembrane receptor protein